MDPKDKVRDPHKLIEKEEVNESYEVNGEADKEIEGLQKQAHEAELVLKLREEICEEAEEEDD